MAHLLIDFRPPPLKSIHPPRKHNPKEDDHQPDRKPRIQRRAQRHIILFPPRRLAPPDLIVEHVAHDAPHAEVQTRGWRDPGQTAEDNSEVDFAEDGFALVAREIPEHDGGHGADEEGPDEWTVERTGTEEPSRPDDAPEDTAVEVDASDRACEAVDGLRCADPRDESEHPVEDANLGETGNDSCGEL